MKKIYFSLLLTINITSIYCMDGKLLAIQGLNDLVEIALYENVPSNGSYTNSTHKPNNPPLNHFTTTHNNNSWNEDPRNSIKLKQINNTKTTTNSQKTVAYQEEKPLLQKQISLSPHKEVIQQLYNQASILMNYYGSKNYKRKALITSSDLSKLIYNINKARNYTINEDTLGQYAYDQQSIFGNLSEAITIFFSCLKRYYLTVSITLEELPYTFSTPQETETSSQNSFEQMLKNNNLDTPKKKNVTYNHLVQFPAYCDLANSFINIFNYSRLTMDDFVTCIYAPENISQSNPSPIYMHLKDEFYKQAQQLLYEEFTFDNLYTLLAIIDHAKSERDINDEKELGYSILNFEPTTSIFNWTTNYSSPTTKNRIRLLCELIAAYNTIRENKKTPRSRQYLCYQLKKETNAALPDSFTGKLFDKTLYAFKAYKQLLNAIGILINIKDENFIQARVDETYHTRK